MNDEFYDKIKEYVDDESADHDKYFKLAEMAPTIKAKKILMDIGREEKLHHEFLKEILNDRPTCEISTESKSEDGATVSSNKSFNDSDSTKTATISANIK